MTVFRCGQIKELRCYHFYLCLFLSLCASLPTLFPPLALATYYHSHPGWARREWRQKIVLAHFFFFCGVQSPWQLKLGVQIGHLRNMICSFFETISSPLLSEAGDDPLLLALFSLRPQVQIITGCIQQQRHQQCSSRPLEVAQQLGFSYKAASRVHSYRSQ